MSCLVPVCKQAILHVVQVWSVSPGGVLHKHEPAPGAHRGFQLTTYEERTNPEASTKECRGLMIMSGVGRTYAIGASSGYRSGSHSSTGMLYFTSCV